ncbi:unnamed protein product [Caenorhabditis auriculariae]|uniref:K Homology domain-containing protein n=1 Tax=Caenorhabditis auriculariae TaxID=2777116 RepID=A0A8S1H290_9PELO|nr:unnamed protein product [Caenorhabditis auriculariae]
MLPMSQQEVLATLLLYSFLECVLVQRMTIFRTKLAMQPAAPIAPSLDQTMTVVHMAPSDAVAFAFESGPRLAVLEVVSQTKIQIKESGPDETAIWVTGSEKAIEEAMLSIRKFILEAEKRIRNVSLNTSSRNQPIEPDDHDLNQDSIGHDMSISAFHAPENESRCASCNESTSFDPQLAPPSYQADFCFNNPILALSSQPEIQGPGQLHQQAVAPPGQMRYAPPQGMQHVQGGFQGPLAPYPHPGVPGQIPPSMPLPTSGFQAPRPLNQPAFAAAPSFGQRAPPLPQMPGLIQGPPQVHHQGVAPTAQMASKPRVHSINPLSLQPRRLVSAHRHCLKCREKFKTRVNFINRILLCRSTGNSLRPKECRKYQVASKPRVLSINRLLLRLSMDIFHCHKQCPKQQEVFKFHVLSIRRLSFRLSKVIMHRPQQRLMFKAPISNINNYRQDRNTSNKKHIIIASAAPIFIRNMGKDHNNTPESTNIIIANTAADTRAIQIIIKPLKPIMRTALIGRQSPPMIPQNDRSFIQQAGNFPHDHPEPTQRLANANQTIHGYPTAHYPASPKEMNSPSPQVPLGQHQIFERQRMNIPNMIQPRNVERFEPSPGHFRQDLQQHPQHLNTGNQSFHGFPTATFGNYQHPPQQPSSRVYYIPSMSSAANKSFSSSPAIGPSTGRNPDVSYEPTRPSAYETYMMLEMNSAANRNLLSQSLMNPKWSDAHLTTSHNFQRKPRKRTSSLI